MSETLTETAKWGQKKPKSTRKQSVAKAALRRGLTLSEAAEVAGMSKSYLCTLIKEQVDFRKAKLAGDEVAMGLIETSLTKILADPLEESKDKISAAATLAKFKRLGGFGSERHEIAFVPAEVLESLKP